DLAPQPPVEAEEPRPVDEERHDRRRDRPDREAERVDLVALLREEALHEEDRADGDEDVLAEEKPDVVGGGGVGADAPADLVGERAEAALGGGLGHRREERPHHLGMAAERGEAEGGGDLSDREIDEEDASRGGGADPRDELLGALAEAGALEGA